MKRHPILILAVLILASITLFSGVSPAREGIPKRISNQQHRIDQGVSSGSLTRSEAEILQDNLNHIRDTYSNAKIDGRLSWDEEARLHEMLDKNSKMIHKKERNTKVRRLY